MKKLAKLFAIAASLTTLIFSGCSNLVDDATIEGDSIRAASGRNLTVIAHSNVDTVKFEDASSRMIYPGALNSSNLVFYLVGEDQLGTNNIDEPQKLTFTAKNGTNGSEGIVNVDLATSKYTLRLYALKSDITPADETAITNSDKTVLKATSIVDMRYNQQVSFYLLPFTNGTGAGTFSLKINTDWDARAEFIEDGGLIFGLYSLVDDSVIMETNDTSTEKRALKTSWNNTTRLTNAGYASSVGVKAGSYNFKVKFVSASEGRTYVWSDIIVILTNQTTEATVNIPNIIGKVPDAPAQFTVKYHDPETEYAGYYDAQFIWNGKNSSGDAINNEQYFQIDLLELLDTANNTSDEIAAVLGAAGTIDRDGAGDDAWKTLTTGRTNTVTSIKNTITADSRYIAGSLNSNSQNVTISLPLGHAYLARISAVNDAGHSAYTYMKLAYYDSASEATAAGAGASPAEWTDFITPVTYNAITPAHFPEDSLDVNRFRVTYYLSNGKYLPGTYTAAGTGKDYKSATGAAATKANIKTLNADASADIRYYTQLYKAESSAGAGDGVSGNTLLNPLYVEDNTSPTPVAHALVKDANASSSWATWKNSDGNTLWVVDSGAATGNATSPIKPTAKAVSTKVAVSASDGNYPGYANLVLYADYGAGGVTIYNPADWAILDDDVVLYKNSGSNGLTDNSTVQIATLTNANEFTINNVTANDGYSNLFICVRNKNYSDIQVKIYNQTYGNKWEKSFKTDDANTPKTQHAQDRYVLTAVQPNDWSTNYTDYFTKSGRVYTAVASGSSTPPWAANKYYQKTVDASSAAAGDITFTNFTVPINTVLGSGCYLIYINGYNPNSPAVPYSYVVTMNIVETATYSKVTFEPIDWATTGAKYFKDDAGANAADGSSDTATDCYQKN